MASARRSGYCGPLLLALLCSFLLLSRYGHGFADPSSSWEDLDASEIEALGLTEEELAEGESGDTAVEEEYGEDDFPTGEEEDSQEIVIPEPDVVLLSSSNFSEFVGANQFVMVEFYAPWCGHCQALAPEYSTAATELKPFGVVLAKVDATVENELAQKYGVQGYPTILFFVDGTLKSYAHHRTSEAIVMWIKKKVGPAVTEVISANEALEILEMGSTVVVGLFDKLEGTEVEEYASAAQQEDDVLFYQTNSIELAKLFHIEESTKAPVLVALKNSSEKVVLYDGKFESALISEFVLANKLPLVSVFSRDTATGIFIVIKKQMFLFASPEDAEKVMPAYEEVAKSFKGKITFVYVDSSDEDVGKPIMQFFGVIGEKPTILGFMVSEEQPIKYLLEEEPTLSNIKDFATGFLDAKLKEFYKSELVPEKNDGDVKVVVGKSFDEIVLDESKDVLLEIYTPWCGHCQALEPIYDKLGKGLRGVESLVIAKMDGTENEHPRGKSDGYPTLLFFPAGNKSFDPITVDVEHTVKALYQFLKKNAAIPFKVTKASKDEGSETADLKADSSEIKEKPQESRHEVKDEL